MLCCAYELERTVPWLSLQVGQDPPSLRPSPAVVPCTLRAPRYFCELWVAHTPGKAENSPQGLLHRHVSTWGAP